MKAALKGTIDNHLLRGRNNFQTYGNLSISHKVKLAYVNDLNQKEKLVKRCSQEKWTVKQLDSEIKSISNRKAQPAILKLVSKPDQFVTKYDVDTFQL